MLQPTAEPGLNTQHIMTKKDKKKTGLKHKTWSQARKFARYEWPRFNARIKYAYIFLIYAILVVWAHGKFELPWLIIVATFAFPMVISPLVRQIYVQTVRSKSGSASLTDGTKKNIRLFSDMVQDKTTRHELMSRLYIELHKYDRQINDPDTPTGDNLVSDNIEMLRLKWACPVNCVSGHSYT